MSNSNTTTVANETEVEGGDDNTIISNTTAVSNGTLEEDTRYLVEAEPYYYGDGLYITPLGEKSNSAFQQRFDGYHDTLHVTWWAQLYNNGKRKCYCGRMDGTGYIRRPSRMGRSIDIQVIELQLQVNFVRLAMFCFGSGRCS